MHISSIPNRIKVVLLTPVLIALTWGVVGCGTSQVTATLQAVIAAAEVAVSTISALQPGTIPPDITGQINGYLKAASSATSFAATELASTDSSAVKATKIVGQFAAIAAPNLPAGVPQTVVAVVQAVIGAVANFLTTLQPALPNGGGAIAASARTASPRAASASNVPAQIKLSSADLGKLHLIQARADALFLKIH